MKYKMIQPVFFVIISVSCLCMPAVTAQVAVKEGPIRNATDTLQYAAGAFVGQWLKANSIKITNENLFKKGMADVGYPEKMLINGNQLSVYLNKYLASSQETRAKNDEKQLFAELRLKNGVGLLPSGVAYFIMKPGNGKKISLQDSVELELKGYLPSGQIIEDTYQRKQPLQTRVSNILPGMAEALNQMEENSQWQVFIPAEKAYGSKGNTVVPPFSVLVFEIEVKKIFSK